MKAIILEQAGWIENLVMKEIEKPTIKANEILIQTKAISINPADAKAKYSQEMIDMMFTWVEQIIFGWDVSGIVSEVWTNISEYKVWDRVFGMINFPWVWNAYAEYVAAAESHITKIPENITFEEAAAATLAALTALQVFESRINKDDRVLIHAWAGWVWHYAIQIVKNMWATVITTASQKNEEFVKSLWADQNIDYRVEKFEDVLSDIDFVLDSIGWENTIKSLKVLKNSWGYICLPSMWYTEEEQRLAKEKSIKMENLLVQSSSVDMKKIADLMSKWLLKSHISQSFTFQDLPKAHTALESGRTVWKVIVTI
mgnify:CR=1 FL=1